MILSINDAKKKWCPFFRVAIFQSSNGMGHSVAGYAPNRQDYDEYSPLKGSNCIANECMAWKWYSTAETREFGPKKERMGFCGLMQDGNGLL